MAKKDDKTVKVVAEVAVTSQGQTEVIKTFDASWHRALELPTPANAKFLNFTRIDK